MYNNNIYIYINIMYDIYSGYVHSDNLVCNRL